MANNEPRQRQLELLSSMSRMSRMFAEAARVTSEEREQLLKRERAARAEAEASRKRLREVLESIGDAFFALDRQWRLTYVNDRAVGFTGRPREELIGESVLEAFPELADDAASRELIRAEEKRSVAQFEHYSPRLDRLLHYRVYPSSTGLSVYATDITEQKRAEEKLRESEERYKALYEDNPSMYFTLDTGGRVLSVNRSGAEQLGYTVEELVGRSILDVLHEEDREDTSRYFDACLRHPGRTDAQEARKVCKDGSTLWVRENVRVVQVTNGGTIILLACEDVTERRRAEEERERSLARELELRAQAEERRRISRELHDRVAHTIAVVHQSLELHEALKERDPATAEAKMELARETAKEALTVTRNLSAELRRPEVRRGLEAALTDLLHNIVPPTVHSELHAEGDETLIPPHVRNQLFLTLREAIRNAVTHSGCSRLAVELEIAPDRVVGSVEDDGRGFEPNEMRSGGGLNSMKERAALVGGAFDVSSEPDAGTKIEVSVPLDVA